MQTIRTTYLASAIGCGAALTMSCAFAAQVPGTQTEAPRPALPAPPPANLLRVAPGVPAAAPTADSEVRVAVSQFRFTGNASQPTELLAYLVSGYVGGELSLAELNEAAGVIARHYRAQGWFLAQAYIPAQTPANGVVTIAVLEGRIDTVTVKVAGDAPVDAGYAKRLVAAHLHSGQTITEKGIETPLLLLRDLPRVDVRSVIDPGSAPGTANITVNLVRDPAAALVGGRVELDNFGSRESGSTRLGAEVNVNNPYGLGDALSLRAFLASQSGNTFGRASYSVPFGARGVRLGVSVARLDYVLGKAFESLKPNGVANVFSANVAWPLLRGRDRNLAVQLTAERKNLEDRTTMPFSSDKHALTSARLQLSGDMRDSYAGITLFNVSATTGRLRDDDPLRVANDALTYRTEGNFAKVLYSFQRLQQVAPGLHALFSISGQHANKNLTAAEKFSIGGDSTVRAFPVGALVGDQGYTATAELRWDAPDWFRLGSTDLTSVVFYDAGQVTRNHDNTRVLTPFNSTRISGFGVGVNMGYGANFLFKLSLAWKDRRTETFDPVSQTIIIEPNRGARAWAQASYAF